MTPEQTPQSDPNKKETARPEAEAPDIEQSRDIIPLPPATLAQAAEYYATEAPSDTHDDRLCAIYHPRKATLDAAEQENFTALRDTLHSLIQASSYTINSRANKVPLPISVVKAGPFRCGDDPGNLYDWVEVTHTKTGASLLPDLRPLRHSEMNIEVGIFKAEVFTKDRVRLLHTMTREGAGVEGITHKIDALFDMQTAFEAISHFFGTVHENYGKEAGQRYSHVRELMNREIDARLKEKINARFGRKHREDKEDLFKCFKAEGIGDTTYAASEMSRSGNIHITATVKMPRPDFDLHKPQALEAITFQVSLDPLGKLILTRVRVRDAGFEEVEDDERRDAA